MVRIPNIGLLALLQKNARMPYVQMAKEFGVSETAVRKRVGKLQTQGVIKKFTVEFDPKALGLMRVVIGVDTKPEHYVPTIETLKKMKNIASLYSASGDHMMLAEAWLKDSGELSKLVKRIKKTRGVTKVCPAVTIEKIK